MENEDIWKWSESSEEHRFGRLPFDHYVLKHWDFSLPNDQDQTQWRELIKEYWALSLRERVPYYARANDLANLEPGFNEEMVSRCFLPFHTKQERMAAGSRPSGSSIVLVRTYYGKDLDDQFQDFIDGHHMDGLVLDNRQLYENVDMEKLLLRMPQLVDQEHILEEEDVDRIEEYRRELEPPYAELEEGSLDKASRDAVVLVFVVDEEAMRRDFYKIKWISDHGRVVWETRMPICNFDTFTGCIGDAQWLDEIEHQVTDQDES